MSEAQNPNDRALRDETDPLDGIESALVEPEADLTDGRAISVNQAEEYRETDLLLVSESSEDPIDEAITSNPIAEALAWQSDADVVELVSLSEALRQQNTQLIEHTEQMEKLLDECHSALQLQIERSQSAETRLAEQTIELQTTQGQLTRLFREMETSHQVAQRQQILIETLNEQLQSSQERLAQLERQCALTQQRYQEQSQLLLQSETACGELQDRLGRQQRYTLQFKAALDKCLDMPTIKESVSSNIATTARSENQPQNISELPRTPFKPQPIQPWSAAPESSDQDIDSDRLSLDVGLPILDEEQYSVQAPAFNYGTNPKSKDDRDLRDATPRLSKIDADMDVFVNPFLNAADSNLELESDLSPPPTTDSTPNISLAEEDLWQELERLTQDRVLSQKATSPENPVPELASNSAVQWQDAIDVAAYKSDAEESELLEPAAFCESGIVLALANDESGSSSQTPNWPSPVVYPQRTPKKIKSLAAIDLPTFPRVNKG
ncbi:hypothetical protein [Argonema antarcticum]|uniref:hypothetical protein n=1 Tax=Argonema antarcticum TaxID=2942763 RepID=UPI002011ADDD|nr:hypothetical protein [Argonema antarcticum]MCL1472376.1 hypothetical protein [Argonema antarcticum A004/B2]